MYAFIWAIKEQIIFSSLLKWLGLGFFFGNSVFASNILSKPSPSTFFYKWTDTTQKEPLEVSKANQRLQTAITNPEYMIDNWVELPTSIDALQKKSQRLSLREAILLALRYNPNIQNAELDRIIQRYQLRLAHNEFELQYALAGNATIEKSTYSGIGNVTTPSYLATPEVNLKNKLGTQVGLNIVNNVANYTNYTPVLNFSLTQPLLRGFGKTVNEVNLLNAIDKEWMNKLNLQQAVVDQITAVIISYRNLILSGNNLKNQKRQLYDARRSFEINEKKIAAGQLAPTANIQQSYQIESLNLMVEQGKNNFKTAAQELLQTIGLSPQMRLSVPSDVVVETVKIPSQKEAVECVLRHNTLYLAQKMLLLADERAYSVAKNQQLWQLDLGLNVQSGSVTNVDNNRHSFSSIYNGRNTAESAQLTLTIPMHDLGRRNQLISAKVTLEKDRLNLITMKRVLEAGVTTTINTIHSQRRLYQLARRQLNLAQKSYMLEKKKQQAGIASALDVNNTQNQLIQAEMSLINAKISYLNQVSSLQRILGTTLDYWQIQLRYTG